MLAVPRIGLRLKKLMSCEKAMAPSIYMERNSLEVDTVAAVDTTDSKGGNRDFGMDSWVGESFFGLHKHGFNINILNSLFPEQEERTMKRSLNAV